MEHISDLLWTGPWWKNKANRNPPAKRLYCPALDDQCLNGYDGSVLNGIQIMPEWDKYFGDPSDKTRGLMVAAQTFGSFIMLPFAPLLSDGIGRRKTLSLGSTIIGGGVLLQAMATTVAHFVASRVLIGLGLCIATNAAPLLITELSYPTQRAPITAMYNGSWYIGSILSAWITYATIRTLSGSVWAWRIPSMLQAVPSLFQAVFVWFCPESPRWLVANGHDLEAVKVLTKYHANGRERDPLVYFTYGQIREALSMEREISAMTSYATLFKTPGNRRRMRIVLAIGFFSQWAGNGLVSYYIGDVFKGVGVTDPPTVGLINGSLQIWNCAVAITAAMLVDRLGRRLLFLSSNTGMLITFIGWTLATAFFSTRGDKSAAHAVLGIIPLFYFAYNIAYSPMLVAYALEVLPYRIRARGFTMMNATICIGITTNQFVNPIAIGKLGWKLYIVYCCFLLFQLGYIYLFLVETKGKTLEETAAIFDGQKEVEQVANVGYQAVTESRIRSFKADDVGDVEGGGIPGEDIQLTLSRHNSMAPTIASERSVKTSADTNFYQDATASTNSKAFGRYR
ncbi:Lactose permease [Serendipita indica DSM 11827]|nr:Lactose permease [Serendipita indica DSM 11827]